MNLPRTLGLFNAVMLVVGNVVGAGIFTTSGKLASQIGHPAAFVLVWVAGGMLTLMGALIYAELGAMFPRAGGDYQYLKEAYGPLAGFLVAWLNIAVIMPGSIAGLSIALVANLPGLAQLESAGAKKALAVAIIVVLTAINVRGTRGASWTQAAFALGNLALLLALILGGVFFGAGDLAHFSPQHGAPFAPLDLPGAAMIAVLFTYSGWFAAAYVGSEIRAPERNVPRALFLGTLIVTVLYTAVNAVYLYALPLAEMRGATNVANRAAAALFGERVALVIGAAIVLAIASCVNAAILTGARIAFAVAEDRLFWASLARVHPRFQTPHVALIAQSAIAIALVLLGTFDTLVSYVVFALILTSVATVVGHVVLRQSRGAQPRPFRTPLAPVLCAVFVAAYLSIAISIGASDPATACIGAGIALTGVPVYFVWKRTRRAKPTE